MKCRHCLSALEIDMIDLGNAPPSNAYLRADMVMAPERTFPLKVLVCETCWLAQTVDFAMAEDLFDGEYAYFSSFSTSWLSHAEAYVGKMVDRFRLDRSSHVVEIASNDGYLLQFVQKRNIACMGIEPTASTARAAREKGIETLEAFFGEAVGRELAGSGKSADLIAANNVLAHVPDINDFLAGFAALLKQDGVATFEFPHLLQLLALNQFDTIYHEHFSYLSLTALESIFPAAGLSIFDVESLPTHGGSLRVYAQRSIGGRRTVEPSVAAMLRRESEAGLKSPQTYQGFQAHAETVKDDFLSFLIDAKREGKRVAGYGAAAKGNTLLNFSGCRTDFVEYVVDRNPAKQGKYMPGNRLPIVDEGRLLADKPDYIVIFPWNLKTEVAAQLDYTRAWGARFVTAVPNLQVF